MTSVDNRLDASTDRTLEGVRVIIVVGDLELGGAQRQALLMGEYLMHEAKANVEYWGLTTRVGAVAQLCAEQGIPWRHIPLNWFLRRKDKFRQLVKLTMALRRAKPDVILSYLIQPNVACGLVWRWTGARMCIWNQRCAGLERLGRRAESMAVRRVPWFTANSQAGAEFLVRTLAAPAERVRVIHNIIQLAPLQMEPSGWRKSLGLSDKTFTACMVANLNQYKDHATLLRAWRFVVDRLERDGKSCVLLLAGGFDKNSQSLKALAFDLNLGKSVRFLGQVKDISGLLGASDLAILSSPSEGSPNGVLEAMALGLAVTGTDNPGMREALGPEGYKFLAPAHHAQALANRITQLAFDNSLRAQAGSTNRLRIEKDFNPGVAGNRMVSLILEGLYQEKPQACDPISTVPNTSFSGGGMLKNDPA